ncbi:MAG: DUF3710 domain-containing protein [Nocardioidaceae bacterium]
MIFRRRKTEQDETAEQSAESMTGTAGDEMEELDRARPRGPWDRNDTTADDDGSYVDLGGLLVRGGPGLELRLQINDATQLVEAVLLAGPESGLELRAFAAPRFDSIWDDVRTDIAAEAGKRGGTATEVDGEFGTELKVVVPVQTPDGRQATQPSRIVGVEGPRWLLRGTFLGASAQEADPDGVIEQAFRDVIVVRGDGPMAPREMIAMRMPPDVQQDAGLGTANPASDAEDDG